MEQAHPVEEEIVWESTGFIDKLPKLEQCLQNTIFEWMDWCWASNYMPESSYLLADIKYEIFQSFLDESQNIKFLPSPSVAKKLSHMRFDLKKANILRRLTRCCSLQLDDILEEQVSDLSHSSQEEITVYSAVSSGLCQVTNNSYVEWKMEKNFEIPHPKYFCKSR